MLISYIDHSNAVEAERKETMKWKRMCLEMFNLQQHLQRDEKKIVRKVKRALKAAGMTD